MSCWMGAAAFALLIIAAIFLTSFSVYAANPSDATTTRHAPKNPKRKTTAKGGAHPTAVLNNPSGSRLDRYALILSDAPLARRVASRTQLSSVTAVAGRQQIEAAQNRLRSALAAHKIHVIGATHVLLNAVYVIAPAIDVATLGSLPGVARVLRMVPIHRNLNLALGLVNVPAAWNLVGGEQNAGAGMRIGILDTGLDDLHPAFQDSSLSPPASYPPSSGTDEPNWPDYTNHKIIVARSYVDQLVDFGDAGLSRPDDLSPYDRVGHGTASAMIAAGETVSAPLATITGVAPKAFLGNYKIFGSPGVNDITFSDVVIHALEDALTDGMDVVSLGAGVPLDLPATWGPDDSGSTCGVAATEPCDPFAAAVENAMNMGLTVVTSAGNDGDTGYSPPSYGSIGSPGTVTQAITVGASYNAHVFYASVQTPGNNVPSNVQQLNAFFADSPKPKGMLTAPLADVSQIGGTNNANACYPLPSNSLSGSIVLVQRSPSCSFDLQGINTENAGAVGIVFYQYAGIDFIFSIEGLTELGIPAALIGNTDGTNLQSFLSSHANHPVTLNPAISERPATADYVAYFSSRGPATGTSAIKPDLVAVGTDLYTATQSYDPNGDLYDPSRYTVVQGTSFATPMVAGTIAMVKQLNPSLTPSQLKSAVVNTASETVSDFDANGNQVLAGIETVGAGKLNAGAAVQNTVAIEPATLSFGIISTSLPAINLTLTNFGSTPVNLKLNVNPFFTDPNAHVALSSASLTLGPQQAATITASLQGNLPTSGIYEGDVDISGGPVPLHVPYLYMVGDGSPVNAFALRGDDFADAANTGVIGDLLMKVVDQYGAPVTDYPVRFYNTIGGGTITSGGATTDNLGIGFAQAAVGDAGFQEFAVDIGNPVAFTLYFDGRAFVPPNFPANGVVNAASFLQNQEGLAPGSFISIFGTGLSEVTRSSFTPYFPLSLGNVSVSFDVPSQNISLPGRIVFASPGQINLQVPWELAGQSSVQMKVSIGLISSPVVTISLNAYAPGFFEYTTSGGNTHAAAQDANFQLIGPPNPAKRGSTILFYANGLGPVDNTPPTGEPTPAQAPHTTSTPVVTIGGQTAQVVFSGLSPQSIALYQVNVVVPEGLASGSQTVTLSANGINAKSTTIIVQ